MIFVLSLAFIVSGQYIIAVNEQPPFSSCSKIFSGFEVDLLREALNMYGWRDKEDYKFICENTTEKYHATIGRVLMDSYKYSKSYTYSNPTHNGQLGIMAYSSTILSTTNTLDTLSGYLWLTVPGAALIVAISLAVIEHVPNKKIAYFLRNMKLINWISMSGVFFGEQDHAYRFPSKFLMIGYMLFLLIIYCLLLAGAILHIQRNVQLIDFPEKLEGLRYSTYSQFLDYVSIYGGYYVDVDINSANVEEKLHYLSSGYLNAIVLEYETLKNIDSIECDFCLMSKPFNSFFYAVAIEPGTSPELKTAIDVGLSILIREYDIESLKKAYFYSEGTCTSTLNAILPLAMYQFMDIFAVYVIVITFIFILERMCKNREFNKERNKYIDEIRELLARPESKILKITENQMRSIDGQFQELIDELEKNMKKNNTHEEKLINLLRTQEVNFR